MCWKRRQGICVGSVLLQTGSQLAPGSAQGEAWASRRSGRAGQEDSTFLRSIFVHLQSISASFHQASEVPGSSEPAHTGSVEVVLPSLLAPVRRTEGQVLAEGSEANSCAYKAGRETYLKRKEKKNNKTCLHLNQPN